MGWFSTMLWDLLLKSKKKGLVHVLLIRIRICADMWAYVRLNVILLTGNYTTMLQSNKLLSTGSK